MSKSLNELKTEVKRHNFIGRSYRLPIDFPESDALAFQDFINLLLDYIEALESENEKMSDYLSSMAGDWTEE